VKSGVIIGISKKNISLLKRYTLMSFSFLRPVVLNTPGDSVKFLHNRSACNIMKINVPEEEELFPTKNIISFIVKRQVICLHIVLTSDTDICKQHLNNTAAHTRCIG
jgi:hypothetical protein